MNSELILRILFYILLLNSCYKSTEWEDVTADYDPVLNVIGIISLDENVKSFVGVYRTTDLTDTSMYFTAMDSSYEYGKWYYESSYEPALFIDSAIVIISTDTDTFIFNFDEDDRRYYNNFFSPKEDSTYNLRIEVNGFDPVTGELKTPSIPIIDSLLIDTLSSTSTYTINWENNQDSAEHGILIGERVDRYAWVDSYVLLCGGEFSSVVEFESEEYTVFPQWCDSEQISVGDIDNDYGGLSERGLVSKDECYCNEYYSYDKNIEKCICNQDIDDCEDIIDLGCDSYIFGIPIKEYCPKTCAMCVSTELDPIDDRIWNIPEFIIFEHYDISIDSLQTYIGYCGDGNPDYETLRIRLMAMDDNYYEYFAAEKFKDFSNFLFETSGISGQSIGIEGGFGVFGAFASDTLSRVLSP